MIKLVNLRFFCENYLKNLMTIYKIDYNKKYTMFWEPGIGLK